MPKFQVKSIASAIPKDIQLNSDFAELFGSKEIARISKSSGISSLRVSKQHTASDLCQEAAQLLLNDTDRSEIKGIVFVSQTPDFILPATSCTLQNRLGLPTDIVTYDVNGGCCGFIHGLHLASMLSESHNGDILLLCGDTITKHISPKDRSLRLIMGDAGTAALVGRSDAEASPFRFYTDGTRYRSLIIPAGGMRNPTNEENGLVTERENGNLRSDQNLFMDGMEIMKFALSDVVSLIKETFGEIQSTVDTFVFHQANKFIVEALAKNLGLPKEKVPLAVEGYGNTGSASIPLALCHHFSQGLNNPGKTLMVGFGVGLTCGAAVCDLSETRFFLLRKCRHDRF